MILVALEVTALAFWNHISSRFLPDCLCLFSDLSFLPLLLNGIYEPSVLEFLFLTIGMTFPLEFVERWAKRDTKTALIKKLTKVIDFYLGFLLLFLVGTFAGIVFDWVSPILMMKLFAAAAFPYIALHFACVIFRSGDVPQS